jgi:hypothetical protein
MQFIPAINATVFVAMSMGIPNKKEGPLHFSQPQTQGASGVVGVAHRAAWHPESSFSDAIGKSELPR